MWVQQGSGQGTGPVLSCPLDSDPPPCSLPPTAGTADGQARPLLQAAPPCGKGKAESLSAASASETKLFPSLVRDLLSGADAARRL